MSANHGGIETAPSIVTNSSPHLALAHLYTTFVDDAAVKQSDVSSGTSYKGADVRTYTTQSADTISVLEVHYAIHSIATYYIYLVSNASTQPKTVNKTSMD